MRINTKIIISAIATMVLFTAEVRAGIVGLIWQNQQPAANDAILAYGQSGSSQYLGTPDATFTPSAINFNPSDSSSNYSLQLFLGPQTYTNQSARFAAGSSYTPFNSSQDNGFPAVYGPTGTLNETYIYLTGQVFLNAGSNSFVVGHDDGVQLNIDGIGLVVNLPGPTSLSNTPFNVTAPTAGFYNFELSYGETAGPPAALVWNINGQALVTPEPGTLSLMALTFASFLGGAWFKRRKKAFEAADSVSLAV